MANISKYIIEILNTIIIQKKCIKQYIICKLKNLNYMKKIKEAQKNFLQNAKSQA